ncbi:hypothetical protein ACSQ67_006060 [Phaseolus vulgaris]
MEHMASFVPPPPSSLVSKTPQQGHQVFLSFRGEDTRYAFTSHLYAALRRLQVKTYIDNDLERGDEISPSLLKAIHDAKVSVVVFSQNYASSRWCLDELVKITHCKRNNGQIIVPVFYHVDPTHVRHQTGTYAHAFELHQKRFLADINRVQTWRLALTEVANISGWDCSTTSVESELVEIIGRDILEKLECMRGGGLERRIGMYKEMAQQKLEKSLRTGDLRDMEELITTLQQLGEVKLEKAMQTDDSSVWKEVMETYERILQLKQDKWMRTINTKDMEDLIATRRHVMQLQREQCNRRMGFRGI